MDIPIYSTTVEQVTSRTADGTPYCRLHEVVTDGSDYVADCAERWEEMTDKDRREFDEWLSELHDAYVAVESAEPEVRERYEEYAREGRLMEAQPECIRELLLKAEDAAEDGEPAAWPYYIVREDDTDVEEDLGPIATLEEARLRAREWAASGCNDDDSTVWTRVTLSDDTGKVHQVLTVAIDPREPPCTEDEHAWGPDPAAGGFRENPGVWAHGGGVIIYEECEHCGCKRQTDTWAQDRETGEQGLTSVAYELAGMDVR